MPVRDRVDPEHVQLAVLVNRLPFPTVTAVLMLYGHRIVAVEYPPVAPPAAGVTLTAADAAPVPAEFVAVTEQL